MSVFVIATGLTTAVGVSTAAACAAMSAGIDAFSELPYYDNARQPIIGAPVPELEWSLSAPERLAALLRSAVEQVARQLQPMAGQRLALLCVCPEHGRTTVDEPRSGWLGDIAVRALGSGLELRWFRVMRGAPASFQALTLARALLQTRAVDTAVVCAVDSLLDARSLEWLSHRRPLRSMRQADGAIAGEAAAALVLSAVPGSRRNGALVLAGVGFGDEPAARDPAQPLRGDGLTAATKAALADAGLEMHDLGLRMASGADGERELKEHTLSLTRLLRVRLEQLPMWLCAETLGHVGAATGLVQIAWAHETMVRGDLPGTVISCTAFAYDGQRATALLTCLR